MNHIYYHGTSSFFLNFIKQHGLGGINTNEKLRLLELLNFLYIHSEYYLADDVEYKTIRDSTKAMAFQKPLIIEHGKHKGYHNFNHKHTYISYSKIKAISYAITNEYGSEILTRVIELYRMLKIKLKCLDIPAELNCIDIEQLEKRKFFPILIRIKNLNIKSLQTEYGDPVYNYLNEIQNMKKLCDDDIIFEKEQLYNFRLLKSISISQLEFYEIIYSGTIGKSDFRWEKRKL